MNPPSLEHTLQSAVNHHRAGRLAQAEALYRQVLQRQPDNPDALHLLGVIAHQCGRSDVGEQLVRSAIAIDAVNAEYHNNLGEALRAQHKLDDAAESYLRAVALDPLYPEAYANLGIVRRQQGRLDEAAAALLQSVQLKPDHLQAWLQLGIAQMLARRIDDAIASFTTATQLDPGSADAFSNLGVALRDAGRLEAAVAACRRAIDMAPEMAEAHYNLGCALQQQERLDEAIAQFERALELRPQYPQALNNLGATFSRRGQNTAAITALERAIALQPVFPEAWCNYGLMLQSADRPDEAITAYRRAIEQAPSFPDAYNNLGLCLLVHERLGETIEALRTSIAQNPLSAPAHNNLGSALQKQGKPAEAIESYRRALQLDPGMSVAHANILLTMNADPDLSREAIYQEHVAWARRHASPTSVIGPAAHHDRDPDRRLRIGYVSADFRQHSVGFFIEPLLASHDRGNVEIICYSDVLESDAATERMRGLADQWRNVRGTSDDQFAAQIRADHIDILVDLAGHTGSNRLIAFAHKPAPVQVTYLGYPNTTGLSAIDYRFTDAYADPPGMTDQFTAEKFWRLPRCAWCYQPPAQAPDVAPLPAKSAGHVTFGSFNRMSKITRPLLQMWSQLLHRVPDACLMIKAMALNDAGARQTLFDMLRSHDIDENRVELFGKDADPNDHLSHYHRIDIALDTYPYHGTTTTCDALWMGVPVVTLAGDRHVARVGVSLLTNVGMPELVASSPDDYVRIAAELASDTDKLHALRTNLRDQMLRSPLTDAAAFARDVESAYRQMWKAWVK